MKRYNIETKCSIVCNQVSTCITFSSKAKGMCFASKEALKSKNIENEFNLMELPEDLFERDIYIVYDDTNFMSEACRNIIEII